MTPFSAWETLRGQPAFRMHSPWQVWVAAILGRAPAGVRALAASYYSLGRYAMCRGTRLAGAAVAVLEWLAVAQAARLALAMPPRGAAWSEWGADFFEHPMAWSMALAPMAATLLVGVAASVGLSAVARQHRSRHGNFSSWPRVMVSSTLCGVLWWLTVAGAALSFPAGEAGAAAAPAASRGAEPEGTRAELTDLGFERVISLAPSLTETVFALGAGDRLAGRTARCRYPAEAAQVEVIGDYQTPNYEAMLRQRPDLVLALEEHAPAFPRLADMGMRYEVFDHRTLRGLIASLDRLGRLLGKTEEAEALTAALQGALDQAAELAAGTAAEAGGEPLAPRPRVLLVLGRDYSAPRPRQVFVAGSGSLYGELLEAAGAANAYEGPVRFLEMADEALLLLNPDVIVELLGMDDGLPTPAQTLAAWSHLETLSAVANDRVRVIAGDAAFVPGPRTAEFLLELAQAIRPQGGR